VTAASPPPDSEECSSSRGFDQKLLSLYSRGMTTREIQGHLEELYGTEVSHSSSAR